MGRLRRWWSGTRSYQILEIRVKILRQPEPTWRNSGEKPGSFRVVESVTVGYGQPR